MNSPRHPLSALLLGGLLLLIPNVSAHAGSATWNLNPTSRHVFDAIWDPLWSQNRVHELLVYK